MARVRISPMLKPYIDGSKYAVRKIEHREAVAFLVRVHYAKGAANTSVARHGLFDEGGALRGVCVWMPPLPPAARRVATDYDERISWRGVLVLTRLAVEDGQPANAAGLLLGRSMRLVDRKRWPALLTYADAALGHVGTIYRATNWTDEGDVAAGDTWVHRETGEQRGRRRGPRVLSGEEMRALGFERRKSASKRKFVHIIDASGRRLFRAVRA